MQRAGFIVNHSATHRDRVLQCFISDAELFERVNAPGRNCQVNRTPSDDVSFARISTALVEIDIVSTAAQIRSEQSTCESGTNQNKFCHPLRIYKSGNQ